MEHKAPASGTCATGLSGLGTAASPCLIESADQLYQALEGINAVVVGIMIASALYMMKDFYLVSWKDITINLLVIGITWALLNWTRLPSPIIVMIWLFLGWLFLVV